MVVAGALAFFCMAGAGVAYVLYDNYTTPDRSAPDVVVDNYLRAFLVDRNDIRARQLICPDGAELRAVEELRAEMERRERDFDVRVRVVWGSLDDSQTSQGAAVRTTLRIGGYDIADGTARSSRQESWEFHLVDREGWRICGAHKLD
jgi:hypothetical protein